MRKLVAAGAMALGIATLPATAAHAGSTWTVGVKASTTTVTAGHKVVFTGSVRPKAAATGDKVLLQEKFKPGKPWVTQRKARIGPDRNSENVEGRRRVARWRESFRQGELVVRVQRRRVTPRAPFAREDAFAGCGFVVARIRIRRRRERIDVHGERVERFVRESRLNSFRSRREHVIRAEVDAVGETDQRRVSHQIADASVQVRRGVIESWFSAPVPNSGAPGIRLPSGNGST